MGKGGILSFKIHNRKSAVVSNLKSSISHKLLHFLSNYNYNDDVLAEYITVLVCNGKDQYEAKKDLDAFLGERSAEFVSWLWDLLLKYACQSNEDICLSDPKDEIVISSRDGNVDKDPRINRLRGFQNHGTSYSNVSLTEDEKIYHLSTSGCNSVPSNNMEFAEGTQRCPGFAAPLYEVNTNKVLSQTCRNETSRKDGANENINGNSLAYESSGKESSVIPGGGQQSIQCMDKFKKIVYNNCDGLPNQLLHLPKRELISKNLKSSTSGGSLSHRSVGAVPHQNEKSRGSVWDRLGKPCDDISVRGTTVDAHGVGSEEVLNQRTAVLPVPNGEVSRSMEKEVSRQGNRCNNPPNSRNLKHGVSTMFEPHIVNNIRRKRHFGEIGTGPGTRSVSMGERNMDLQCKENSQDFKKPNFMSGDSKTNPNLDSVVLDVKLRLRQIEMEMSKLRSKQLEMAKDGTPNLLSHSGALKHPEEDIQSRTVFVTNVHFAATKEALSLYFSKCGVIEKVVIFTYKATGQPKGSAYVTFASKESVDKALALNGSAFFSRTIKVLRKAEASSVTSATAQLGGKSTQAQLNQLNKKAIPNRPYHYSSHLQWRRESVSATVEPSAPSNVQEKEKGVTFSASQQQLPSSLVPVKNSEANSSIGPPEAA